ncbi:MAG: hypothetical protein PUP91_00810 [Rhizonema sp. PD37]|nr:hypothetical protein [Rhizonema sp. PD37]
MVILDKDLISKAVESNVDNIIHKQLQSIKCELEEKYQQDSLAGKTVDDIRKIQCIVDDATRTISVTNQQLLDERIKEALNKIQEAIAKINEFDKEQKTTLPNKVFQDLTKILNSCQEKLESLRKKLESIRNALTPITTITTKIEESSNKRVFQDWAETIEILAEGLEEMFEISSDIPLGIIEDFARNLLLITAKKSQITTRKDEYRRRLKYAAKFILSLVREKRYESLNENSAEAKAVTRLENTEEIEWVTVLEPEQPINIDKINTRLKKRGYNIQILCED